MMWLYRKYGNTELVYIPKSGESTYRLLEFRKFLDLDFALSTVGGWVHVTASADYVITCWQFSG